MLGRQEGRVQNDTDRDDKVDPGALNDALQNGAQGSQPGQATFQTEDGRLVWTCAVPLTDWRRLLMAKMIHPVIVIAFR